jgi:hypothetical protein
MMGEAVAGYWEKSFPNYGKAVSGTIRKVCGFILLQFADGSD